VHFIFVPSSVGSSAGLPDFYWPMIPKKEKNVPNEHKTYQMVIKYSKWS
jgi:hypothetical protein